MKLLKKFLLSKYYVWAIRLQKKKKYIHGVIEISKKKWKKKCSVIKKLLNEYNKILFF